ncbi:hypothetical protein FS837_007470 [Tulasnella sp. UAMH 9824]|nr:hypothetical protein FS837_007470 [Tulasnella sp. UAMH 9824]
MTNRCGLFIDREAVQKGEVQACAYCEKYPASLPPKYKYCGKTCGAKDTWRSVWRDEAPPLTLITPDKYQYVALAERFQDRWDDPVLAPPQIAAMYQIKVSKKYVDRFKEAVNAAELLGGSRTRATFYGGKCICDLGVPQFGSDQLCSWASCSICIVIRKCFDVLEFKLPHHTGDFGKSIYTNLNPARANRFTVRKSSHPIRAMILCSVIQLEELVQGDRRKHSAFIDDTGRVFCANKDVILPRQLILYKDPEAKAILQ